MKALWSFYCHSVHLTRELQCFLLFMLCVQPYCYFILQYRIHLVMNFISKFLSVLWYSSTALYIVCFVTGFHFLPAILITWFYYLENLILFPTLNLHVIDTCYNRKQNLWDLRFSQQYGLRIHILYTGNSRADLL